MNWAHGCLMLITSKRQGPNDTGVYRPRLEIPGRDRVSLEVEFLHTKKSLEAGGLVMAEKHTISKDPESTNMTANLECQY